MKMSPFGSIFFFWLWWWWLWWCWCWWWPWCRRGWWWWWLLFALFFSFGCLFCWLDWLLLLLLLEWIYNVNLFLIYDLCYCFFTVPLPHSVFFTFIVFFVIINQAFIIPVLRQNKPKILYHHHRHHQHHYYYLLPYHSLIQNSISHTFVNHNSNSMVIYLLNAMCIQLSFFLLNM